MTFCLRWIDDNLEAHEDFIGFYQIPNAEAVTITSVMKDAFNSKIIASFKKMQRPVL